MPQVNPFDRHTVEPYSKHLANRALALEAANNIRLNRASRKGKLAGQKAKGKGADAVEALSKHNPYTETTRAKAWKDAFESAQA